MSKVLCMLHKNPQMQIIIFLVRTCLVFLFEIKFAENHEFILIYLVRSFDILTNMHNFGLFNYILVKKNADIKWV